MEFSIFKVSNIATTVHSLLIYGMFLHLWQKILKKRAKWFWLLPDIIKAVCLSLLSAATLCFCVCFSAWAAISEAWALRTNFPDSCCNFSPKLLVESRRTTNYLGASQRFDTWCWPPQTGTFLCLTRMPAVKWRSWWDVVQAWRMWSFISSSYLYLPKEGKDR